MTNEHVQTFLANAKYAIRNRQSSSIGGGEFSPSELAPVVELLAKSEAVELALRDIATLLEKHPEFLQGNSTIHYCVHKAKSAIGLVDPNTPFEIDAVNKVERQRA